MPSEASSDLAIKEWRLLNVLAGFSRVAVAFSGGADSALALAAATRALGSDEVLAITVSSPSLATGEAHAAGAFACEMGVRHVVAEGSELARSGYRRNDRDRCAFCKTELMEVVSPIATRVLGLGTAVITGTNADDIRDANRPGIVAARERGAHTPLASCGFSKSDVRQLARNWGLSTWDKPQAACLASRIAYGVEVSEAALSRIDRAEISARQVLAIAGARVRNLRVRDLGDDVASLEVDALAVPHIASHWSALKSALTAAGFSQVQLDERGFRSGSLNERAGPGGRSRQLDLQVITPK